MTMTTQAKRRAQKQPQYSQVKEPPKWIDLRIRKSAKLEITYQVAQRDGGEWAGVFTRGPAPPLMLYATEQACLVAGFEYAWDWVRKLKRPAKAQQGILADIEEHARQLLGEFMPPLEGLSISETNGHVSETNGAIPETQAEASAKAAAAGDVDQMEGVTLDFAIALIDEHPSNPRVDYGNLADLAKLLQEQGQLQECIGRRVDGVNSRVELLGGHRRYRAAKMARLKTLRVRVIQCDDARARELLGLDNEARKNFDPVAKGIWYALMIEHDGLSQRQLAEKLGVSQGAIANHVRLLSLPEPWRKRLITREITETHARALAPFAEKPRALAAIEEAYARKHHPLKTKAAAQWPHDVEDVLLRAAMPLTKGAYYNRDVRKGKRSVWMHGSVLFTPAIVEKHRDELDVIDLGSEKKPSLYALNIDRWLELHEPLQAEAQVKASRRNARAEANDSHAAKTRTPAQQKEAREQRRRQLEGHVEDYKVRWLQPRVAEAIKQSEGFVGIKFLIGFACREPDKMTPVLAEVLKARGVKVKSHYERIDVWPTLVPIKADKTMVDLAREVLAAWLSIDAYAYHSPVDPDDVVLMADELKIDFAKEWQVDQTFLKLFRLAELNALVKEWKLWPKQAVGENRSELITQLLRADQTKRLPLPKCLQRPRRHRADGRS